MQDDTNVLYIDSVEPKTLIEGNAYPQTDAWSRILLWSFRDKN